MKSGQIVLVLVLVGLAAYFVLSQQGKAGNAPVAAPAGGAQATGSFEAEAAKVYEVWANHGVDIKNFSLPDNAMDSLTEADLQKIRGELNLVKQGNATSPLAELVDTHQEMVSFVSAWNKFEAGVRAIGVQGFKACEGLPQLKARDQRLADAVDALKGFVKGYDNFRATHPDEAEAAGMTTALEVNVSDLEANLAQKRQSTALVEQNC